MREELNCHESGCCKFSGGTNVAQTFSEMEFERGIWFAAQMNDLSRLEYLSRKGSSLNEEDASGYTALHYAARNGHVEICKFLLERNVNVNAITRSGKATSLHRAAMHGNVNIVLLLLNFKADPNIQDADGYTPLHRAVLAKSKPIWKILKPRTNLNICDKYGLTAQQLADKEVFSTE